MKELFGIPTFDIMLVLVALLGVAISTVAFIGVNNPTMFKMGVRNLPRRGLQTVLVVVGLALATLITTAAFVTGDTIDHSLTSDTYNVTQRSDLDITWTGERNLSIDSGAVAEGQQSLASESAVDQLETRFAGDPDIQTFLPFLSETAAATNQRSGLSTPRVQVTGVDLARLSAAGGLRPASGGKVDVAGLQTNETLLSERAANDLGAKLGDTITVYAVAETHDYRVAGIVKDELASGVLGLSYSTVPGGLVLPLAEAQRIYGFTNGEISSLTVALRGDVRSTLTSADGAAGRLQSYFDGEGANLFASTNEGETARHGQAFTLKKDLIEDAQMNGNVFTTFFLVLGLFSMAAGIMLIFMIFVMLAAERKAEMGMSRAVGAQRGHLVQSFIAEGMAYSLIAGAIGVVLGIGVSYGLTNGLLKAVGGDYFSLVEFKMSPVSVAIGYSLGVVITFATVVFASMKVSHINIVAAIRSLPEDKRRETKRKTRWAWVAAGVPAMIVPPLGIWFMVRKGFGLPWAWIVAPAGLILGGLFMMLGKSSELLFPFALGISLLPLSVAGLARYYRVPARPLWTAVGVLLTAYWLMPSSLHDRLFGTLNGNIEMFVLSGIMIVIGLTLVIVFNARLLTGIFTTAGSGRRGYLVGASMAVAAAIVTALGVATGDRGDGLGQLLYLLAGVLVPVSLLAFAAARFPALAPALKMAIAYPLANRFRTGMTIAMFSIIVFSLTVFSVLLANFGTAFLGGDARGNLDIVATANASKPVGDLRAAVRETGSPAADDIVSIGRTTVATGMTGVLQPGSSQTEPAAYPVLGADDAFLGSLEPKLDSFANGYASEQAVLEAVRTNPSLAIVDATVVGVGFSDYDWTAESVTVKDNRFEPFELEIFNAATGKSQTVTVIGALKVGLPSSTVGGIYVNRAAYTALIGEPLFQRSYLRIADGANAENVAQQIESALATRGVQADSIQKLLDDVAAQNTAFNRMFQAFMALGLLVGIAGLGVIAFRSVVERRQQIGMLRAIGYQRGTVALTFVLESSFVAVMGILSGVIGGAVLGRNLLTSDSFTEGATINFAMPWTELIVVVATSFVFALVMTWLPSRGASRVPVAEALRYE